MSSSRETLPPVFLSRGVDAFGVKVKCKLYSFNPNPTVWTPDIVSWLPISYRLNDPAEIS